MRNEIRRTGILSTSDDSDWSPSDLLICLIMRQGSPDPVGEEKQRGVKGNVHRAEK
jgi:hypothetical protein